MGVELLKLGNQKLPLLIFSQNCSQSSEFIAKLLLCGSCIYKKRFTMAQPLLTVSSTYSQAQSSREADDSAVITHSFSTLAHQEVFPNKASLSSRSGKFSSLIRLHLQKLSLGMSSGGKSKMKAGKVRRNSRMGYLEGCMPKSGAVFFFLGTVRSVELSSSWGALMAEASPHPSAFPSPPLCFAFKV